MAVRTGSPLLILPKGSVSLATVERVCCGGAIRVDLGSARVRRMVEALADQPHDCPADK